MKQKKTGSALGRGLMGVGLAAILAAAGLFGYNSWISMEAGKQSDQAVMALLDEITVRQDQAEAEQSAQSVVEMEVEIHYAEQTEAEADAEEPKPESMELDGAYYMGMLSIPKLEQMLPVQVDWSMEKLKFTPCRYSGTVEDQLVICAHNYITHFADLVTLSQGDSISLTDLNGQKTEYIVEEICKIQPTDIAGMVNSGYDLSLFTCDYSGNARVTVRCSRVEQP